MTVKFVHLCPPVEIDRDLFEDDKAAAERDRDKRYEEAVAGLGAQLRKKGVQCWVPAHKGFVKVDLVPRKGDVEAELVYALQASSGYELAQVLVEDLGHEVRVHIEQDPFGSVTVEAIVAKAERTVKWFGSLMAGELQPLDSPPEQILSDLVEIAAERCSVGRMTDLVLPWSLTPEQRKAVVARDEFVQSALSGGRFLVVASYSGMPLRPVDSRAETVGESKIPGFVKFVASRSALISGSSDGRVSIQTRRVSVREDGTVGQVPDGRLWTGAVDSKSLPERFRAAARAAVKAAACMPERGQQVRWDGGGKSRARDVETGEDIPCEIVEPEAPAAKAETEAKAQPPTSEPPRLDVQALKDLV